MIVPRRDRDPEFTDFMRESAPALGRIAVALTGEQDAARELVQQSLVKLYFAWDRLGDGDPFAYARRILMNQRVDGWRKRRRELLTEPAELVRMMDGRTPAYSHDSDTLVAALQRLAPKVRRVVLLRYVEGLPESEVATELGLPLGTVKSRASRGLAQLRVLLGEKEA